MSDDILLTEINDHIARLTLNRPDQANSLSQDLFIAIKDTLAALDEDDDVRVVIITGAGERFFCAGVDLKERGAMSEDEVWENRRLAVKPCFDAFRRFTKPIIAAVNGVALGGGAEIALACDIRLATPNAQFAHTEINWGMIPAAGAHQRLRKVVGIGMAKEIMFTGRKLEAAEAERLGIYNHVYEPSQMMAEAMAMAATIAGHSPLAVRQSKKVYDTYTYSDEAFEFEYQASIDCYTDGDAMTGAKSFKT
ncbi:MAG: enoyl-CoA hydratase-related protein [Rhodospirillales bacterium]|jgi:enoyl-CoA hydratase/carnithine racemase|nr:enoyl-CoA hydratase-related protein [Rhodospirillales bacterium]|tara:strand:- start:601 stop:1353 length:753 start_codon:yes stop_codon:yes gene_type:complete